VLHFVVEVSSVAIILMGQNLDCAAVVLGGDGFELVEEAEARHRVSDQKCYTFTPSNQKCYALPAREPAAAHVRDLAEKAGRETAVQLNGALWRVT